MQLPALPATSKGNSPMLRQHLFRQLPLPVCSLILLSAVLLGSCSSTKPSSADVISAGFAELRATANTAISDSLRREKYLQASQRLETELRTFEEYARDAVGNFQAVFKDYDAGQDTLKRLSTEFYGQRKMAQDRVIDAHLAMAASVTASEWKVLVKKENTIFKDLRDAAQRSVQ
jgi:hypothetical protein